MKTALDELIVARATAAGPGALAVVRLDGVGTTELLGRLFHPTRGAGPAAHPRQMVFGRWLDPADGSLIDEGLAVFFAAPHSYTGNDVAEFHTHGGPVPSRRLIEAALALGARMAEPGEFTRRAFLNGKMDLTQAEAVADLISAQTEKAARLACSQYAGGLSGEVSALREGLIALGAEIEARIDFPEEELEPEDRERLEGIWAWAAERIQRLLGTQKRGRLLREGARVVLAGLPNAGKSSLLNALVRMERAIVTPHPGTTRDTIECTLDLDGVPLTLVDTAGLRQSADPIERIGIERSGREIERADLVVLVHDATSPEGPVRYVGLEPAARPPDLIVLNKIDLLAGPAPLDGPVPAIPLSSTRGDGLARLEAEILRRLSGANGGAEALDLAVNLRQGELLAKAQASLGAARRSFGEDASGELVMVDLREAIDLLSAILGVQTGEAILDRLFSRFCIGK